MDASPSPTVSSGPPAFGAQMLGAPRKSPLDDAHFDVTPMVDLVFMMNIYFIVVWVTTAMAEIDLPTARHCVAVDADATYVITLKMPDGQNVKGKPPLVYLGEVSPGSELSNNELEQQITDAVLAAVTADTKKTTVLIKAEKDVRFKDVSKIAYAVTKVSGVKLNMAVIEKE
jgi:biopolymer transport protein ExbD